jgi:2-hydroxy-3-oxopropionate reductase
MPKFAANLTILFNELDFADRFAAAAGARTPQISLPNTATCQELFNACAARGGRAWDHSAMVRALELLGAHEIGQRNGSAGTLD